MPLLLMFSFTALRLPVQAGDADIILVQGTSSLPSAAERSYAAHLTRRFSTWLEALHVPYRLSDDDTAGTVLKGHPQVAVLTYNASLPTATLATLKQFVAKGGKVLVFYSADPRLADLLGVELGAYQADPLEQRWVSMRFSSSAPRHLPRNVRQTSRNIRPVRPRGTGTRRIARWVGSDGTVSDDTAWVLSPQGAWMSHVLLDDGDTANKQQMLLALLAHFRPSLWDEAATASIASAANAVPSLTPADRRRTLRDAPRSEANRARVALERSDEKLAEARRHLANGRGAESFIAARQSAELLTLAHARLQEPRKGEIVGIWDHTGTGLYPGDWPRTCAELRRAGITDLFVNVAWAGAAVFTTPRVSEQEAMQRWGDQLAAALVAGHKEGLRVHAWKVCWKLGPVAPAVRKKWQASGRLQVSDRGKQLDWLCPSDPANLAHEVGLIEDMVRGYALDGVHLDYIRYPDSHACYCEGCHRRFEAHIGRELQWPDEARTPVLTADFNAWRCANITELVRSTRRTLRKHEPDTILSAAVYGKYPSCVPSVAQDWARWLREGWVDAICPMNYTNDPVRFEDLLRLQAALSQGRGMVWPGIGVTASESRLSPLQTMAQIRSVRRAAFSGYVLFDLNHNTAAETLPLLSEGLTRPAPASPVRTR